MNASVALDPAQASELTTTRLTVPGIRCAGCIAKIERELPKLAGVVTARVNFSAKRVAVGHEKELDEGVLERAMRELGFEAQAAAENPLAEDDKETKRLLRAVGVAGFGAGAPSASASRRPMSSLNMIRRSMLAYSITCVSSSQRGCGERSRAE